jgi:glycosyltransferase involved in cell wall biosynthesis
MKASVIVRTYNRAHIVRDTLDSIFAQTHSPLEVLVVDDGSTDNTEEVVRAVRDGRMRYLRHENNRGVAAACNTGIEATKGEAIAFADSDDLWTPNYLRRQVEFLQAHPGVGAVFTDAESRQNGIASDTTTHHLDSFKVFPQLFPPSTGPEKVFSRREIQLCLLQEIPIKPSALVMRKSAVEATGRFNEDWICGEDWEFLLRLAEVTDFGCIREPLVIRRHFSDSTFRQHVIEDKQLLLRLFAGKKSRLKNDDEALRSVRNGIASHVDVLGCEYLKSRRPLRAMWTYLRGWWHTHDPLMVGRAATCFLPLKWRDRIRELRRALYGLQ